MLQLLFQLSRYRKKKKSTTERVSFKTFTSTCRESKKPCKLWYDKKLWTSSTFFHYTILNSQCIQHKIFKCPAIHIIGKETGNKLLINKICKAQRCFQAIRLLYCEILHTLIKLYARFPTQLGQAEGKPPWNCLLSTPWYIGLYISRYTTLRWTVILAPSTVVRKEKNFSDALRITKITRAGIYYPNFWLYKGEKLTPTEFKFTWLVNHDVLKLGGGGSFPLYRINSGLDGKNVLNQFTPFN